MTTRALCHCCRTMRRRAGVKVVATVVVVVCLTLYEANVHVFSERTESPSQQQGRQPADTVQSPDNMTSVWLHPLYAQRRHLAQDVCSTLRGGHVEVLTRWGNVSYCPVPKAGCTFWLTVFRFLHNDTGNDTYVSPFHVPRVITHYAPYTTMEFFMPNLTHAPAHLVRDLRFMVVREPYSRLWSAYVDKFLLLDFWRTDGQFIVKARQGKKNACANDISFREFVSHVVSSSNSSSLNIHWRPVQHLCSPCLFQPHVIGKMETFLSDAQYVLARLNQSWMLEEDLSHEAHALHEMQMLVAYNWDLLDNHPHYPSCTNASDLADRLWRAFQINGYLPLETPLPGHDGKLNASSFLRLVVQAYRQRAAPSPAGWRHQRQRMMAEAFGEIPIELLHKLRDLYAEDFRLFGYPPEPDWLFAGRAERSGNDAMTKSGTTVAAGPSNARRAR